MAAKQRELVIEVESVRVVRKRAATRLRLCPSCSQKADFISLTGAADLFEVNSDDLLRFLESNSCHYQTAEGDLQICVSTLVAAIQAGKNDCGIKFIESSTP